MSDPPAFDDAATVSSATAEPVSFALLADRVARAIPGLGDEAHEVLWQVEELDRAVYMAVANAPTPVIDHALRRLSNAANYSQLWVGISAALAVVGGRRGREAATDGLVAVLVTSGLVNQAIKRVAERERPDRVGSGMPEHRHVRMPRSHSFPSGHSASAFAYASAVSRRLPALAVPLHVLAAGVAYSRVHVGVHFPGDVMVGSVLGMGTGQMAGSLAGWVRRHRHG
jgi:membrane-associated phospholipid phosphatase